MSRDPDDTHIRPRAHLGTHGRRYRSGSSRTCRILLLVALGIAQALVVGCADRRQDRSDVAGTDYCPDRSAMEIDWPMKVGIGAWKQGPPGWVADRVGALGVAWYYVWEPQPSNFDGQTSQPEFVPMIWSDAQLLSNPQALTDIAKSEATTLLGFNEPNLPSQADMTVEDAVTLWPRLAASRMRLGSPAPSQGAALAPGSWLPRFMDAVFVSGLRVDFVAVHYYASTHDVTAFRRFLEDVHRAYDRPIWVTEWALVDPRTWKDRRARYSSEDAACFFRAGAKMLDDLGFVERHAWFAAFEGGGGLNLNTHAIAADGSLTPVGRAIVDATGANADKECTGPATVTSVLLGIVRMKGD